MEYENIKRMIGQRIEIPVHYNLWMRGARYGTIVAAYHGKPGTSAYASVKIDHPQVRRRLKLWAHDIAYAKFI